MRWRSVLSVPTHLLAPFRHSLKARDWVALEWSIATPLIAPAAALAIERDIDPSTWRWERQAVALSLAITVLALNAIYKLDWNLRELRKRAEPRILLVETEIKDLRLLEPVRGNQDPHVEFARAIFKNSPHRNGPEGDLDRVHARIEVFDDDHRLLDVLDGRWADLDSARAKSIDLPASGETRILDLISRRLGENECYGWDHNAAQMRDTPIPPGSYEIKVTLSASVVDDQIFRFALENPFENGGPILETASKQT